MVMRRRILVALLLVASAAGLLVFQATAEDKNTCLKRCHDMYMSCLSYIETNSDPDKKQARMKECEDRYNRCESECH